MSKDLTDAQIREAEDHIAYEGLVELENWIDTSGHGFKVRLRLSDRMQLDFFDGVMTMRKKRGGQRYHAIVNIIIQSGPPPTSEQAEKYGLTTQQEWQFCGRGWSESKGAHIAVHIGDLTSIGWWRQRKCRDQGEPEDRGTMMQIMLMELGDDEIIVNQAKRARVHGVADPQPKGGPRSKAMAMLIQDPDFLWWFNKRSIYKRHDGDEFMAADIDKLVKKALGIDSKVQLDNDEDKDQLWQKWEVNFHRPFLAYMQRSAMGRG